MKVDKVGFTLIELIVVITIIVILGAISFITFQGYSKESRDAKRLQDVRSLLTEMNIDHAKGIMYEEMLIGTIVHNVTINKDSNKQAIQGMLDFNLFKEKQSNFQDPSSKADYDFATANGTTIINGVEEFYNFIQGRYWSEKQNKQILLGNYYKYDLGDSDNLFDGDLTDIPGGDNPDITPSNSCINNGQVITVTGVRYKNTQETGGKTCDTDDIIVCTGIGIGYQISACNVGAKYAGAWKNCPASDTTFTTDNNCSPDYMGYHFQWGNNYPFSMMTSPKTSSTQEVGNRPYSSSTFIMKNPWDSNSNKDLWGGITGTNIAKQGPCASGYHVPSNLEWQGIYNSLGISNGPMFANILKLPFAGGRYWYYSNLNYQSKVGYYWSSTSNSAENAYYLFFNSSEVLPQYNYDLSFGFSVRCIKN